MLLDVDMKFVHAADLHLDSPLAGLARYEGANHGAIRTATRRALQNLVDLCLQEQAAFLLFRAVAFVAILGQDRPDLLLEEFDLLVRLSRLIVRCGSEMRHQPFEFRVFGRNDRLSNDFRRGADPEPAHAAVNFEVIPRALAFSRGELFQLPKIFKRMNHRRQVVGEHCLTRER